MHRMVMDWPDDAVAEIERLRAERDALIDWQRRAVNISAPFAAWDLPHMASFEDDRPIFAIDGRTVTIGDVRRLRALIEEAGHE